MYIALLIPTRIPIALFNSCIYDLLVRAQLQKTPFHFSIWLICHVACLIGLTIHGFQPQYMRSSHKRSEAEIAFLVVDEFQGKYV